MDTFPTQKNTSVSSFGYNENGFPSQKTTVNLYKPSAPLAALPVVEQPKTLTQKISSGISTMGKNISQLPAMFKQTQATQESISRANKLAELARKTGLTQTKDGFSFTNPNAQKVLADFAKKSASPGANADERIKNINATIATLITDMLAYPLTAATKTKPVKAVLKGVEKVGEVVSYPASKIWSVGEAVRTGQTPVKVWSDLKKAYETPVPGYKPSIAQQTALGVEQSVAPMAVGASLSLIPVVGKPLSSLYFAAQSANEELRKTGGEMTVKGVANVAIDTYFDSKIGNVLEGLFKEGALSSKKTLKVILSNVAKGGFTEGGTEVIQSLAKYGVDYNSAKTTVEKDRIMSQAIDYVRNGMIPEFTASFIGGGALTGIGEVVSPTVVSPTQVAQTQLQEKPIQEIQTGVPIQTQSAQAVQTIEGQVQDTFPRQKVAVEPTVVGADIPRYLYHGTSNINLENIIKEGLTPGGTSKTISLSKTEPYATSFAESSVFPAQEGQGIVLRVRADLVKAKARTGNIPLSDQLNELVTNKTIPPEALEIKVNGKWQPLSQLTTEPTITAETQQLSQEALKYKTAEEFVKGPHQAAEQPTKPSGLAQRIETSAIEKGLTDSFKDTAEYSPTTVKEQSQMISDVMNSDIELAKKMVKGEKPLLSGMNPGYIIKAMTDYAMQNNDGELIRDIAKSPLTSETSAAAQTLRMLKELDTDSATARVKEVINTRENAVKKKIGGKTAVKMQQEITQEIKDTIAKSKPNKYSWTSFVDEITC